MRRGCLRVFAALLLAAVSFCRGEEGPCALAHPAILGPSAESVMASATVYDVLLDRQNHLWAATQNGIFRLDGRQSLQVPFPANAPAPHVRSMLETRDGALWCGTEADGLWRRHEGVWTSWRKGQGLPVDRINGMAEGTDGALWLATGGGGVVRFKDGSWTTFDRAAGLGDPWVWKVRVFHGPDGRDELWAATQGGLFVFDGQRWSPPNLGPGLPGGAFNDLWETQGAAGQREIWATAWKRGVLRWQKGQWITHGPRNGFPSLTPTSLAVTRHPATGRPLVWVGTYDAGVVCFEEGRWHHYEKGTLLASTGIYALCANPAGRPTLWLGCRGAGVLSLNLHGWRQLDEDSGLPTSDVICFADRQDPQEGRQFWIGTGRGLFRWAQGRWLDELKLPLRVNALLATAEPDGTPLLWAGTMNGLVRKDRQGVKVLGPRDGVPNVQIFGLAESRDANGQPVLWAGSEIGLVRYGEGAWRMFTAADGLPHAWINDVCHTALASGGRVWVATRGGGTAYLEGSRWITCNRGLPSAVVNGFKTTRSSDGRTWLWAATGGSGLARLDAQRPQDGWQIFDTAAFPGMPSTFLYRLALDERGHLYASSTHGILRFQLQERDGVPVPVAQDTYTLGDGLPSLSLFSHAFRDLDGRIWFGTLKGGMVLDPAAEPVPGPLGRPVVESIRADGRPFPTLTRPSFSPRQQRLVFEYRFTSHHRAEDTRYRTQLVGVESGPGPWYSEGYRELSGLAPGDYTLRIWAQDFQGRVTAPLDLPFRVEAPLWRRPWAIAIYLAAFGGLLVLTVHLRSLLLHRRNRELQSLVAQRTQELAGVNEGLVALNDQHVQLIEELQQALGEVRTLEGIIPICMHCKKIRDDEGYWNQLEAYLAQHSEARFSHGYCPDCLTIARRDLEEYKTRTPGGLLP